MKTVFFKRVFDRNSGEVYVRKDVPSALSMSPEILIIFKEGEFKHKEHQIVMNQNEVYVLAHALQAALEAKDNDAQE